MTYTKSEEKELNQQLARWKKRQLAAFKGNHIDDAFEKMNDNERAVWEQVAKAESYKNVSIGAWELAEKENDNAVKDNIIAIISIGRLSCCYGSL